MKDQGDRRQRALMRTASRLAHGLSRNNWYFDTNTVVKLAVVVVDGQSKGS